MNRVTSNYFTMLVLRFLKKYGIFGDYYIYFKKYHQDYARLRGGFVLYINNQLINKHYRYYDASVLYSIIFDYYTDWLLDNNKDAFNIFYDVCGLLNIYLDDNGCNNGTIIDTYMYKDINKS